MAALATVLRTVRAELVEAPSFFFELVAKEGRPFDKLRANGSLEKAELNQ